MFQSLKVWIGDEHFLVLILVLVLMTRLAVSLQLQQDGQWLWYWEGCCQLPVSCKCWEAWGGCLLGKGLRWLALRGKRCQRAAEGVGVAIREVRHGIA